MLRVPISYIVLGVNKAYFEDKERALFALFWEVLKSNGLIMFMPQRALRNHMTKTWLNKGKGKFYWHKSWLVKGVLA